MSTMVMLSANEYKQQLLKGKCKVFIENIILDLLTKSINWKDYGTSNEKEYHTLSELIEDKTDQLCEKITEKNLLIDVEKDEEIAGEVLAELFPLVGSCMHEDNVYEFECAFKKFLESIIIY